MANKIKLRRGNSSNMPTLDEGELGYTKDTKQVYVGTNSGNKPVGANLSQVYGSKNLVFPDISDKQYLGNGVYRLYNANGITLDYDVFSGIYTFNGTNTATVGVISFDITPNTQYTLSYFGVSGTLTGGNLRFVITSPYSVILTQEQGNTNKQNTFTTTTQKLLSVEMSSGRTFNNYQFKLQLEKGDTATPYTLPMYVTPELLATKANDNEVVKLSNDQHISGYKRFLQSIQTVKNIDFLNEDGSYRGVLTFIDGKANVMAGSKTGEIAVMSDIPTTASQVGARPAGNVPWTEVSSKPAFAPSNAQKNSDITKAEIEAKLTGTIKTHNHNYLEQDNLQVNLDSHKLSWQQYSNYTSPDGGNWHHALRMQHGGYPANGYYRELLMPFGSNSLYISQVTNGPKTITKIATEDWTNSSFLKLNGGSRLNYPVNTLMQFRPNNPSYNTGIFYGTDGNEAMSFVARNSVTSFQFVTGSDPSTWNSGSWSSASPTLQIKNKSVYVNELIPNNTTPGYTFSVNGLSRLSGGIHTYYNGASTYTNTNIVLNERESVGTSQSSDAYAPGIGFHWSKKHGKLLIMDSTGNLKWNGNKIFDYIPLNGGIIPDSNTSWGNQTGHAIASFTDSTSGGLIFRRDNPSEGKMSMIIDGVVYINEGQDKVASEDWVRTNYVMKYIVDGGYRNNTLTLSNEELAGKSIAFVSLSTSSNLSVILTATLVISNRSLITQTDIQYTQDLIAKVVYNGSSRTFIASSQKGSWQWFIDEVILI